MHKLKHLATSLFASVVAHSALGDSVSPAEPGAYEPFVLELEIPLQSGGGSEVAFVLDIDPSSGTLLVGYSDYRKSFITLPYAVRQIEIQGLPPGTYSVSTVYMPDLADGDPAVHDTGFSFTVADAPATQSVYAFFHGNIEHYFITASDDEADGLLAQGGWELVDFGFNAWHADDPAPEATVPVCRFYSGTANSHFYTGSAEECTLLQEEDHGWVYEGIAFQALLPVDGACPVGTTPVWRLFNDRAAELDSNHRFVASGETYRAMIAEGWIGEGVAFCSPPESV